MGALYFITLFIQWWYAQRQKTLPGSRAMLLSQVRSRASNGARWPAPDAITGATTNRKRYTTDFVKMYYLTGCMLMSGALLMACSGPSLGGSSTQTSQGTATGSQTTLARLHWCGKPLMVFRDEGASANPQGATPSAATTATATPASGTPKTIDDWEQVKSNLGFTVFLPPSLSAGTCLMNASATVHDPIFGGNFTIGYLLPDRSSISLSEAPLRSQNTAFQCSPSSTTDKTKAGASAQNAVQLCSGARETTHIVFSARGATPALERFFRGLQPGIVWTPA
jgi:hypothetical protein